MEKTDAAICLKKKTKKLKERLKEYQKNYGISKNSKYNNE